MRGVKILKIKSYIHPAAGSKVASSAIFLYFVDWRLSSWGYWSSETFPAWWL